MKTTKQTLMITILASAILIVIVLTDKTATGQIRQQIRQSADNLQEYYTEPAKNGDYILTIYNDIIDFNNSTNEQIGAVILGGLLVSYNSANRGEYVGVILLTADEQVIAMAVRKTDLRNFIEGRDTVEELLANTQRIAIDLNDMPGISSTAHH